MDILLLGVGPIGREYARILAALGHDVQAIGRGPEGCAAFEAETGVAATPGGSAILAEGSAPATAIVAVGEAHLGNAARDAIRAGARSILVEKPGGANAGDVRDLARFAKLHGVDVRVAYNRRFHASTLATQRMIEEDGGLTSLFFEFTEWSHRIEPIDKEPGVKEDWFLQNSSHVIDLAFHVGGWPREMRGFAAGTLSWHPRARYVGAGITTRGALFSYLGDWQAPGRWSVEFLTRKRRMILRPMETVQVQMLGSVAIEPFEIDDMLDRQYKPGFYRQTAEFLANPQALLSIDEQAEHLATYAEMTGNDRT